jgi:hypothetical protein
MKNVERRNVKCKIEGKKLRKKGKKPLPFCHSPAPRLYFWRIKSSIPNAKN